MPAHKKPHSRKASKKDLSVHFDHPANGDPPLSSPDCLMSPPSVEYGKMLSPLSNERSLYAFSQDEKIANLTELNNTLVRKVTSLRFDKEKLKGSMKELEKQLKDDATCGDALFRENQELKRYNEDLAAKIFALEHDKFVLGEENIALSKENMDVLTEREELESALLQTRQGLADSLKQLQKSESSAAIAKARMDILDADVQKLLTDIKSLNEENESLKALISERRREELQRRMITMEEERQSLFSEVEKGAENAYNAKRMMETLRREVLRLKEENIRIETNFKQENANLRTDLSASKICCVEIENEKFQVVEKLKQFEAEITFLQQELNLAKAKQDKVSLELEKEHELKRDLLEEISMVISSKKMLEESLNFALASLDEFQENAQGKANQLLSLEKQIAVFTNEKAELQKSKRDLELKLQTRITVLTNEVTLKQAENSELKQKLSPLNMVLWDIKREAKCGEKKLWKMVSEVRSVQALFDKKAQVAKYALPIAAVSSSTLAFVGLLAYLRFRKKH